MKLTSGWARTAVSRELSGLQFCNQRKSGEGEKTFVFLE